MAKLLCVENIMLNISEPLSENPDMLGFNHPLFKLAFRPYFVLGSFTSIVALVIWLANLNGMFSVLSLYTIARPRNDFVL